jgi:hypothetical protein
MWAFSWSLSSYYSWFVYKYCFFCRISLSSTLCNICDIELQGKDVDQHNAGKVHRALEQAFRYLTHEELKDFRTKFKAKGWMKNAILQELQDLYNVRKSTNVGHM